MFFSYFKDVLTILQLITCIFISFTVILQSVVITFQSWTFQNTVKNAVYLLGWCRKYVLPLVNRSSMVVVEEWFSLQRLEKHTSCYHLLQYLMFLKLTWNFICMQCFNSSHSDSLLARRRLYQSVIKIDFVLVINCLLQNIEDAHG